MSDIEKPIHFYYIQVCKYSCNIGKHGRKIWWELSMFLCILSLINHKNETRKLTVTVLTPTFSGKQSVLVDSFAGGL